MESPVKEKYHSELRRIDWDFNRSRHDSANYSYHWYPARFVPQIPGILINYFSKPGELVLDPFCGSGTTLVEAYKFGRTAVGIDVNPVAALITKSKLVKFDSKSFLEFSRYISLRINENLLQYELYKTNEEFLKDRIPNLEENRDWYHFDSLIELAAIWQTLQEQRDSAYYPVGMATFSAILKKSCSQDKHWGWICDNVKPKKLVYKNAIIAFIEKLNDYEHDSNELVLEISELQDKKVHLSDFEVIQDDCVKGLSRFNDEHFDLIVTSPPYYNVTDYIKAQRLSNLWFAHDFELLKKKEIGARYRRSTSKALEAYLDQMRMCFTEIRRVLKMNHFCCVVIGESPKHAPYLSKFEMLCEEIGLEICDTLLRNITSDRSLVASVLEEKIFIFRKK